MQNIVIDPRGALPTAVQAFVVPDDPAAIALAIESLIARLDERGGDPDLELDESDLEPAGDELDCAWLEWHTMRGSQKRAPNIAGFNEDIEDDEGGGDTSGDEGEADFSRQRPGYGAGCNISDPDYGGEEAGERDEGECGHTRRYGVDQTKPIGPQNPVYDA